MRRDGRSQPSRDGDVLKGLVAGLAGGLVATVVMTQFQNLWSKLAPEGGGAEGEESSGRQSGQAKGEQRGQQSREEGGEEQEPATAKAASAISENVFGHELTKGEKQTAGQVVHYGFGTTMGALYGAAAELLPGVTAGAGLGFGTLLFLGADEVAVPATGLSEPPAEVPLSKHAYGLVSHLVYGLTADLVRRGVRGVL